MKQKIVIRVSKNGQKSRRQTLMSAVGFSGTDHPSKALQIAVTLGGVERAGLVGTEKDQIEVIGDEIDAARLTALLRKRIGFADLVTVTPVGAEKKEEKKEEPKLAPVLWPHGVPQYQFFEMRDYSQYRDPYACSIM